jgi:tetratricopeptide (TPR) repeat protein
VELGHWADAAASCESAWQVSLARVERLGQTRDHTDLHSLSWLGPIYAQLGQRARADQALDTFAKIVEGGGYAAIAFIDSALSVVRDSKRWDRLEARLSPVTATLPAIESRYVQSRSVDTLPMPSVVRAFRAAALATAAARGRDIERAKQYRAELKAAHEQAAEFAPRYTAQAVYQAAARADDLRVDAEIAAAEGKVAAAEEALRQVIPLEATEAASDGANPGRISSYERLGELALGAGRNREAADDFARALERTPGRSNTLHQAALAAERLGENARAADLWSALARNWADADADFPGVAAMRAHAR